MKRMERIISLVLCGAILLGYLLAPAHAEDIAQIGLCEHHQEHINCSYAPAVEGHECGHEHTDECYQSVTECTHSHRECGYIPAVEGHGCDCQPNENGEIVHTEDCGYVEAVSEVSCGHICSEETGCVKQELNCRHEHNSECGYAEASEGLPCTFECEECAKVNNRPKTAMFASGTVMAASVGAVTCEQVTEKVLQYKSIINQWCAANNTSTAYWNAHVRGKSDSCKDGKTYYSDPTEYIKSRVNVGDYTSYLTAAPCPSGSSHSHGSNTCYSNEFGSAWQCNGFANYMNYIVFGLTKKNGNGSVTTGFESFNFVPGDIVMYGKVGSDSVHFRYIYDVDDTYVYYVAGNDDGECGIRFGKMTIATARNGYTTSAFRPLKEVFRSAAVDAESVRGAVGAGSGESKTPTLSISNWKDIPDLDFGSGFGLRGTISTDYGVITSVTGSVLNSSGGVVLTHTDTPNTSTYNIQTGINNDLSFGTLSSGRYTIKVQATANNNGKTNTQELVNQSFTVGSSNYYAFDIKGLLDDVEGASLGGFGTCDVYINGELMADDCLDYSSQGIPEGSTYEIRDIRATDGHNYAGVYAGQLSGTVSGNTTVVLKFFSNPSATLSQNTTDIVVGENGAYITYSYAGDTAHGYGYVIESSNSAVATASLSGDNAIKVYGVSVGTCKIVFQLVETDTDVILDTAECIVKVSRAGNFGNGLKYNVTPDGHMTISGTGAIPDYNMVSSPWQDWRNEIKMLTIEEGITRIGWSAFLSCESIQQVALPESLCEIETSAFAFCTSLKQIVIPGGVKTLNEVFAKCTSLESAIIFDGVQEICGSFPYCTNLKTIIIPESVTTITDFSFDECTSLADVYYKGSRGGWKAISVGASNDALTTATIHYAKVDNPSGTCGEGLTWTLEDGVLTISGSGTMANYTDVSTDGTQGTPAPWYRLRKNISKIVIEEGVASIGSWAFYNCTNATSVLIPSSVTAVGDAAFFGCSGLTEVMVPSSITELGNLIFANCTGLSSISLPDKLQVIGNDAFLGCTRLSSVSIPDSVSYIGSGSFQCCTSLGSVSIPDNVTSIGSYAFYGCANMTKVFFGSSITSIGNDAFYGCGNLTDVYITDIAAWVSIDTTERADHPFYCNDKEKRLYLNEQLVTDVVIPDGVTYIGGRSFYNCTSIKSITLPSSVTEFSQFNVFTGCSNLTDVYISDLAAWVKLKSHPMMANENMKLYLDGRLITDLVIPDGITRIEDSSFGYCSSIRSVSLSDSVSQIGDYAFMECDNLQNITMNNGIAVIGEHAFDRCANLSGIELPSSIIKIHYAAFSRCKSLESITLPESLAYLGDFAFNNCTSLSEITFEGNAPEFQYDPGPDITEITTFRNVMAKVYYPAENETWNSDTMQQYGGTLTWVPYGAVENRLNLDLTELGDVRTVWVDGVQYAVQISGDTAYLDLPNNARSMITYGYHVGDAADVHTQYPISMKVWTLEKQEDGSYKANRVEALDDILQYSGSSIRITGNKGIRMITSVPQEKKNTMVSGSLAGYKLLEYGTVLAQVSKMADGPLVLGPEYAKSNYAYKRGVADPVFAYAGDLVQYTNVLVGFTNDQCKEDIAMRPYMILENEKGEQVTLYGGIVYRSIGYIAYQNRSVFAVGSAAYNYVWEIIHHVYGDKYDAEYKG